MNIINSMTAKIMGEILADGMSLCDVNLAEEVNSVAIRELDKIRAVLWNDDKNDKEKVGEIKRIIKTGVV